MAKKTNNDLLADILNDLDQIIKDQKRAEQNTNSKTKSNKSSNIPSLWPEVDSKKTKENEKATVSMLNTIKLMVDTVSGSKKVKNEDIEHLKNIITTLTSVLDNITLKEDLVKGFERFASTIVSLNALMTGLNENLLKTIWKYNKVRGKLLGKSLAGFYTAFFEAFEEEKTFTKLKDVSNEQVNSLLSVGLFLTNILSLNAKNIKKVSASLSKFSKDAITTMAVLLRTIIEVVNNESLATKDYDTKIKNFGSLLEVLSTVPVSVLVKMGKRLNPEDGEKIGNYFKSLIGPIASIDKESLKHASDVVKSISLLIATITLSLVVVVILATTVKPKHILGGFGILASVVGFTILLILALNKISFNGKNSEVDGKQAILTAGAISILILSLTLSLAIVTSIAKKYTWRDIGSGLAILLAVAVIGVGIIHALSLRKLQQLGKDALITGGLLILVSISLIILTEVFKKATEDWDKVLLGGVIMGAVLLIMIGLTALASKINMKKALKGIIAVGAMTLLVMLVAGAVAIYSTLMDSLSGLSWRDLGEGSAKVALVLAGFLAIVTGLGLILLIPGSLAVLIAGAVALAAIGGLIIEISAAIMIYNSMIRDVLSIEKTDMKSAEDRIIGDDGMVGSITKIIEGLCKISVTSAIKAHIIADNLNPLFRTISKFMKIIEQMANLRYIEGYDDNGNPIYGKLPDTVFKSASKTLADGFADFINTLGSAFDEKSENIAMVKMICEQLTPNGLKRIIGGAPSVNDLLNSLGKFVKIVEKMANLKFVDSYDEKGNPVYKTYDPTLFPTAAETLVNGFKYFLDTIYIGFKDSSDDIESIIDDIADGDTMKLMSCLSNFVDAIDKMANLKFVTGYDDKGNPIYATYGGEGLDPNVLFYTAASILASGFSTFLKKLHTGLKDCSGNIEDIIDDIGDGDTLDLFNALSVFMDTIVKYGEAKMPTDWDINGKPIKWDKIDMEDSAKNIATAFTTFLNTLQTNLSKKTKDIEYIIDAIGGKKGIVTIFDALNKFLDPCIKIAQGNINGQEITIDQLKEVASGLVGILNEFIKNAPELKSIKDFPTAMKLLDKGVKSYGSIIKIIQKLGNDRKDSRTLPEIGDDFSKFNLILIDSIGNINKTDFLKFRTSMIHLKASTKDILSALNRFKSIEKFKSEDFLTELNDIQGGVDKFLKSLQTHYQIRVDAHLESIDNNKEIELINNLGNEAAGFSEVEKHVKATADLMKRLVDLEKEWSNLSTNSVFNKLSETLVKLANALKEAITLFQEQATNNSIGIQIDPNSIAAGIEQASWSMRNGSTVFNKE